jgi:hypothetical protein
VAVAALRQPRPRPADGPGNVTLVSRTGARRGFVAPLNAALASRSATGSTLLHTQKLAATEMPFLFREQPRTIRMESRLQAVPTG